MARQLKKQFVLGRINRAGKSGVPDDASRLLQKWGVDGDPRRLEGMLVEMRSDGDVCRETRELGDGRLVSFIVGKNFAQ